MRVSRRGFTLVELLVVIAIIAVLMALLLPAVQRVRESASSLQCKSQLRQLGIALHHYHDVHGSLPPALITDQSDLTSISTTGFTLLLPFIEQGNVQTRFNLDALWNDVSNYEAIAMQVPLYFCPSNRDRGLLDLLPIAAEWGVTLPPAAAGLDYAFCKGANGALNWRWEKTPVAVRGVFGIRRTSDGKGGGVRFIEITDGTSQTIAMGDAAAGSPDYLVRDVLAAGDQVLISPYTGRPVILEQSWSAASVTNYERPWYGSVLAVTAQYGLGPDPRDEPMNRRPATPTIWGSDVRGDNSRGLDFVGGFRSKHSGGCNFLFCDASVQFLSQGIRPETYRALSTYAGDEAITDEY